MDNQQSNNSSNINSTSSGLLEQLVYSDNFMNTGTSAEELTPNLDIDGQLSIDLASFANDSFIFLDEEKHNIEYDNHSDISQYNGNIGRNHDNNVNVNTNMNRNLNNNNDSDNGNNNGNRNGNKNKNKNLENNNSSPIDSNVNISNIRPYNINQNEIGSSSLTNQINFSKLPKFPVPPGAKSSLESAGLSQCQIDLLSVLVAQYQLNLANKLFTKHLESNKGSYSVEKSLQINPPVGQHHQLEIDNELIDQRIHCLNTEKTGDALSSSNLESLNSEYLTLLIGSIKTSGSNEGISLTEFDKRRRNTAASARFRLKKKLKEKQMENKILHLDKLVKIFETKTQQLEMENKLLKNLIIEKGSQKSENEVKLLKDKVRSDYGWYKI